MVQFENFQLWLVPDIVLNAQKPINTQFYTFYSLLHMAKNGKNQPKWGIRNLLT